ncbi:anhydro-N-acetylmuramic acid kinase [Aureitalea sp. L0-47]|nr:anhydro-N-acetylmuramic acid kinase [Aureitalea sp. L0-47]
MVKSKYKVLGVMSGTSLDGIDLAECTLEFSEANGWSYKIGVAETVAYPAQWSSSLREAIGYSETQLKSLNIEYTRYLSKVVRRFIAKHQLYDLDAVCSHGHTILHQPDKGITLQIGNLSELARLTGKKVVCDFRVQDVALGGQGAPLVPMGDRLLFGAYDYCLNLGGFANISSEVNQRRIAYDVCPVNIVMNRYANKLGEPYDPEGSIARSGTVDQRVLERLNDLAYYQMPAPKSLGLEWVLQNIIPVLEETNISPPDVLRTFVEHIVLQIAAQFNENSKVLVSGGGAYNSFLIDRLKSLKNLQIVIPDNDLVDYKEALIFALLGVLRLRNEVNCLASVTGAKKDHCSGFVYDP